MREIKEGRKRMKSIDQQKPNTNEDLIVLRKELKERYEKWEHELTGLKRRLKKN